MSKGSKKDIDAEDVNIKTLLKERKFYIDYFQREYRWEEKHMKILIEDLSSTFLKAFDPQDRRSDVSDYQHYYIGPIVFSEQEDGKKSIIDGQQRITSITLFLIFLNNLQKKNTEKVNIKELIFSETYGKKSFNMTDEAREPCLTALFKEGEYAIRDTDDETIRNMVQRYNDIDQVFPEKIREEPVLPYFIDWLIENVVIVEITAYSEEDAYTIFETMNDRGLNLTPVEMLKGYILSRIPNVEKRTEIDDIWKKEIQKLHVYGDTADQAFFQAWFRGKYAETFRTGKKGSINQDFELIGSKLHSWFKDNHKEIFKLETSEQFHDFFKVEFQFFVDNYVKILKAKEQYNENLPYLHYVEYFGIADSLQEALLLSTINSNDKERVINQKYNFIARFIETFTVKRAVNYRKFGQTTIKYGMFKLIKDVRGADDMSSLGERLIKEINGMEQTWTNMFEFGLHGQNKSFVRHLLARISSYIDNAAGKNATYVDYQHPKEKQFEIEHIWGDKVEEHRDEFEQNEEFQRYRNLIGALVLLPNGTNQSFSSDKYEDKLDHYLKENTYVQTLNEKYYEKNPNFMKSSIINQLDFRPHEAFRKKDIEERTDLVRRICEKIWSVDYYRKENDN